MLSFNPANFETVTTKKALGSWIKRLNQAKSYCADTETTGLDTFTVDLVGVALSVEEKGNVESCYIPVAHHKEHGKQLDTGTVLTELAPVLQSGKPNLWSNALYDMEVLSQPRYDIKFRNIHDIIFMAYVLFGKTLPSLGMDFLSLKFLNFKTIKFADVVLNRPGRTDFRDVPLNEATHYAAEDTAVTFVIGRRLQQALKDQGLWEVYQRDRALLPVLLHMRKNGAMVDTAMLNDLEHTWSIECLELRNKMFELAGYEFNPGSHIQVKELLESRGHTLPLVKDKKTRQEKTSVAKEVLEQLAPDELVDVKLEWTGKSKLLTTYARPLPAKTDENQRIRCSFNPWATKTGRFSSSGPSLQNIPVRSEDGAKLRAAFIARANHKLVCADYSQIEYRVLAHITQQAELIEAFKTGVDVHARTIATIRGKDVSLVSKPERNVGKTVNFAAIYGAGPNTVARQAKIDPLEATLLLTDYWEALPDVLTWKEETLKFARKHLYSETLFGRRIFVPYINSKNSELRGHAERLAINGVVQGSSADLMRMAMVLCYDELEAARLIQALCGLGMTVHDELVGEFHDDHVEKAKHIVEHSMIHAADQLVDWKVPIEVDAKSAQNWKDAK